jgi:hypothetical protein
MNIKIIKVFFLAKEVGSKVLTNPKYIRKDRYKKQDGGDIKSIMYQTCLQEKVKISNHILELNEN